MPVSACGEIFMKKLAYDSVLTYNTHSNIFKVILMYAVVTNGGRQFMMRVGDTCKVDRLAAEVGAEVRYEDVLLVGGSDTTATGKDVAKKAVVLEVLEHKKDKKINIIKFKRRKHHMKRMGHRQGYTVVKVKSIK